MTRRFWLVALAAALVVPGCGGSESAPAPSAGTTTNPSDSSTTSTEAAAGALQIDIQIAGGTVTPTNATFDAQVGEPIVLVVDSDAGDELHVHSVPEYTFEVTSGDGQRFEFTVDVPGRVDVELHDAGVTVATIAVGA